MTLLSKFLKLLKFLEASQEVFSFLMSPVGLSTMLALGLYFPSQIIGCCDIPTAALTSAGCGFGLYLLIELANG